MNLALILLKTEPAHPLFDAVPIIYQDAICTAAYTAGVKYIYDKLVFTDA